MEDEKRGERVHLAKPQNRAGGSGKWEQSRLTLGMKPSWLWNWRATNGVEAAEGGLRLGSEDDGPPHPAVLIITPALGDVEMHSLTWCCTIRAPPPCFPARRARLSIPQRIWHSKSFHCGPAKDGTAESHGDNVVGSQQARAVPARFLHRPLRARVAPAGQLSYQSCSPDDVNVDGTGLRGEDAYAHTYTHTHPHGDKRLLLPGRRLIACGAAQAVMDAEL